MSTELTPVEAASLAEHEAVIERGLATFVEVGNALLAIRDQREYRAQYATFEDYCQQRWGFTRDFAYKTIRAAEVATGLVDHGLQSPATERQARELARIPEERRAEVWQQTLERTDGKPTAAAIRETYAPPAPEPASEPDLLTENEWVQHDAEPPTPRETASAGPTAATEQIAAAVAEERAAAFDRAIADFPELEHYADRPAKAIALADNLRQFTEPELSMRRDNLAKAIAADQRRAEEPDEPTGPDYYALADEIFLALNQTAQVIARNGGPDTIRQAITDCAPLMIETWREQFTDLAATCTTLAEACTPRLRRLK